MMLTGAVRGNSVVKGGAGLVRETWLEPEQGAE